MKSISSLVLLLMLLQAKSCNPPPPVVTVIHGASIAWKESIAVDVFNIYRAQVSGGPYQKIGSTTLTHYSDVTVVGGQTYFYVVKAETSGVESTDSNQITVSVPGP